MMKGEHTTMSARVSEVSAGSRQALRRRRSWQVVSACATAAAVAFSLAVAGTLPVPGVGDGTLPGSEALRDLFGVGEVAASGCATPDPAVQRMPDPEAPASTRPVTYDLTDARPLSTCFDVRIDATLQAVSGLSPETMTEDGGFWRASQLGDGYFVGYQVFGTREYAGQLTGDHNSVVTGLTAHGRQAAWYEYGGATAEERATAAYTLKTTTTLTGDIRTITEIPRRDTGNPAMTDERIAWRHGSTVSEVPADGSGQPSVLARQATAVGSDSDEMVVASLGQDADGFATTTFTSYGDDGSVTTLLAVGNPGDEHVSAVDITDNVLAYASGDELVIVPRRYETGSLYQDQTVSVRLSGNGVNNLSAAGDAVAWVSGPVAYLVRDASPTWSGASLVRIGQNGPNEPMLIGLAENRIAWNTAGGSASEAMVNVGTLVERWDLTPRSTEPEPRGSAVLNPAAPAVRVPEDADFPSYD